MSENPRHIARVIVLKSIYAIEHSDSDIDEVFDSISDPENISEKYKKFAAELFKSVRERKEWADDLIEQYSKNWKLERIADIDRNIMEMALTELEIFIDTPVKVVINEAIELAKEFSTAESSGFINGILDAYVKAADHSSVEKK